MKNSGNALMTNAETTLQNMGMTFKYDILKQTE